MYSLPLQLKRGVHVFTQYWPLLLAAFSLIMEGIALFYQYVMVYDPCVLCIYIRIWLALFIILGVIQWLLPSQWVIDVLYGASSTAVVAGFGYTSYQLMAAESGWEPLMWINEFASCGLSLDLWPAFSWFRVDEWLPSFFKPLDSCGYTPEVFGIVTFAQALWGIWFLLVLLHVLYLVSVGARAFSSKIH